jgi:hypothetical protein
MGDGVAIVRTCVQINVCFRRGCLSECESGADNGGVLCLSFTLSTQHLQRPSPLPAVPLFNDFSSVFLQLWVLTYLVSFLVFSERKKCVRSLIAVFAMSPHLCDPNPLF